MVRSGAVAPDTILPDTIRRDTMRAAVYRGDHTIEVDEVAVPEMGPLDVMLEVSHCGICGTDLHLVMENFGSPGSVPGHEYSGVVAAVGAEVEGWSVGDRAVGGPGPGCGRCRPCLLSASNLCEERPRLGLAPFTGAFARYKVVAADSLYPIPENLDLRTAALTEPVAVAWRGIRRAGLGLDATGAGAGRGAAGARVLITGGGPIGLISAALLRACGVEDVTVSEPAPARRQLAAKVGATAVVEPHELVAPDLPMYLVERPYQAAIECSGRADATESALAQLDRCGVLVLSGTGLRRPKVDPNRMILNELTITGTVEYTADDYRHALDLLASDRLPTDVLIEAEDIPLGRIQTTMERLMAGELAGKVMVVPHA